MLQDRRLIAVIVLLMVAAGAWDAYYFGVRRPSALRTAASRATTVLLARNGAPGAATPIPAAGPGQAVPAALPAHARNPFLTLREQYGDKSEGQATDTRDTGSTSLRLDGIAVYGGVRTALVGGEPVREGEWVGDVKVLRVADDRVVLARAGVTWTVTLPPLDAPTAGADR